MTLCGPILPTSFAREDEVSNWPVKIKCIQCRIGLSQTCPNEEMSHHVCAESPRSPGEWMKEFHKFSDNRDQRLLNAHPVTSTELSTLPGLSHLILTAAL